MVCGWNASTSAIELIVFAVLGAGPAEIVGAIEHDIARVRHELRRLEQSAERHTLPLADAAPALDAIVPGDLRARRHGAEIGKRQFKLLFDQAPDHELPVGESIRHVGLVVCVVRIGRAVGLEVARDLSLAIFACQRLRREDRALGDAGQRLGRIENAPDPRLVRKIVAAAEQHGARRGKPARKEAAPVETPLLAHGFSSAGSIT